MKRCPKFPLVKLHPIDIPVADPAALDRAADLILKAERPLVMLGAAASRPRLAGPLSDFVRRVRIPFFNTQMGKGSVAGGFRASTWAPPPSRNATMCIERLIVPI